MTYDVVIVGAGSAGCVLAARLSEDPNRRVLLLEAGPDYPTSASLPLDLADGSRLPSDRSRSHDWGWASAAGASTGVPPLPLPRGWVVGGSSAVNGTFALRGAPADHDDWAAAGNDGWDHAAVLPIYRALETDLDHGDRPWHGDRGPVPIRRYPPEERSILACSYLEAAAKAGHPEVTDHNEPDVLGVGPLPVNTVDRLRMSAALTHLAPARTRANLTVRALAPCDQVLLQHGRARGVQLIGGEVVQAEQVVVAAGAYASPALLLRSGIGSAERLRQLGIEPHVHLPGVGQNLVDHVLASIDVAVPAEPIARPNYQTMLTWRGDGVSGPPELHLFACGPFETDRVDRHSRLAPIIVGLLDPDARGRVELRSADPTAPPHIDLGYLSAPRDADRLVVGLQLAREILATEPLRSLVRGPELSPGEQVTSTAALRALLPRLVRTYHHPVGTCRMGPDPDDGAVVDPRGALHGVERLRVIDASIMPRIPRANTNLPTLMLAERLAADLCLSA